jgi:hypothetical protein
MAQPIWTTPAGSLGSYPYGYSISIILLAEPVSPATTVSYTLLSGTLPNVLTLNSVTGYITGTPSLVLEDTTTTFTIRATDNLGNIRDRTFSMLISGSALPQFTTPGGILLTTLDSIWTQLQIEYTDPDSSNPAVVELQEGLIPPGLEINYKGLIQGYPTPPISETTLPAVSTLATSTLAENDYVYVLSVSGITEGRPVYFTGDTISTISPGQVYYVKYVDTTLNAFSISVTQNGNTFSLSDDVGTMSVTLPQTSIGSPTVRSYNFVLRLVSLLGTTTQSYAITVINQNLAVSQGGPGNPPNTRLPTLLNTRPLVINPPDTDIYYGYYLLPPISPNQNAEIGTAQSDNYFAFKLIGYDFDNNDISYICSGLPTGITYDSKTGWITGTPTLALPGINTYRFTAQAVKSNNTNIGSPVFNFGFNLALDIVGDVTWITSSNLGTVFNGTPSTLKVLAESDVDLQYRVASGTLPPNLILLDNGEITGIVANQPTDVFLEGGTSTDFTFTIQAFSPIYAIIQSTKTFTVTVYQEYSQPTDTLYIEATPSIQDRQLLASLLNNDELIPPEAIYRPDDVYFGKATSVIYEHAYGIYASDIQQYIAAVTRNHYWRNITLGELRAAVAKDENGNVIYEVVYSSVIDNLVNPQGVSIESSIYWPRPIDLNLGPWYTSITDIFTSYADDISGNLTYYTSLTPGFARTLYPNSLYNMRNRVADVLGQVYNSTLLPLWMTSQQPDTAANRALGIAGGTLGYTPAWVICYTKPGYADIVKANIENNWGYTSYTTGTAQFVPYSLNQINFNIDRFSVNKSITYDWDNNLTPPAWTGLPSANPVPNPLNSQDFYVLFPRETILPNNSQY